MMILNVSEMRDFETYTMEVLDMKEVELMHQAGKALTKDFINRTNANKNSRISLILGTGNNGGDGLVMALELQKSGFKTTIYIIGNIDNTSDAFSHYFKMIDGYSNILNNDGVNEYRNEILNTDFIIDGLFGIGLARDITDYRKDLIHLINQSTAQKYSIDIPSGLNPNTGLVMNTCVNADFTGIVGYYKLGNLLNNALDMQGEIQVVDIGLITKYIINRQYIDLEDQHLHVPNIAHGMNKYTKGLGLFFGGRKQMMGSIQMSAISGLKSGLGIACVGSNLTHSFTQFYPELIIKDYQDEDFNELIEKAKVVVFGPGMEKQDKRYLELFEKVMNEDKPVILDATGLEYLDLEKKYMNKQVILTPHTGEMARLFNVRTKSVLENPLKYVNTLTNLGYHVILKGQTTIIASQDEMLFIQAKNPGLATAGSGDVLSGIIAGYAAHYDLFDTMVQAVTLHSRAGMLAREKYSEISMTATNIIEHIHEVIKKG